ncbi:hypothetical protein [Anaerotignum propionicum]|nr:hypothetical protein [Anaerotignum propionicum]
MGNFRGFVCEQMREVALHVVSIAEIEAISEIIRFLSKDTNDT